MDLQKEIWRDVDGYEGKYQVSNFGRVKSLARRVWISCFKLIKNNCLLVARAKVYYI